MKISINRHPWQLLRGWKTSHRCIRSSHETPIIVHTQSQNILKLRRKIRRRSKGISIQQQQKKIKKKNNKIGCRTTCWTEYWRHNKSTHQYEIHRIRSWNKSIVVTVHRFFYCICLSCSSLCKWWKWQLPIPVSACSSHVFIA